MSTTITGSLMMTLETKLEPDPNFPNGSDVDSFGGTIFDWANRLIYMAVTGRDDDGNTIAGISVRNADTMEVFRTVTLDQMFEGTSFGSPPGFPIEQTIYSLCVGNNTNLYMTMTVAPGTLAIYTRLFRIDKNTLKVTGTFYISGGSPPPINNVESPGSYGVVNTTSSHEVVGFPTNIGAGGMPEFFDGTNMVPIGLGPTPRFHGVFGEHTLIAGARHDNGSCDFIYINSDFVTTHTGEIDIWKINITNGLFINSTVSTIHGFDYYPDMDPYHIVSIAEVEYDVTHNAILMWLSWFDSLSPRYLMSANFDGTVNWVIKPPVFDATPSAYSPGRSNLVGNTLMLGGGRSFQLLDTSNGQLLFSGAPVNLTNIIGFGAFYRNYDASTMSYYAYALSAGQARVKFFPPLPTQTFRVPQEYIAFATCCDRAIMAHLYQFTSVLGTNDYFTDFDIDIFYNGVIWKASSLRFEGLQRKIGVGLSVDEQSLKIWASPTDTMFGARFLTGAEEGLLDGAIIVRKRAIWEFHSGNVASDIQHNPLAVWTLFTGYTSSIAKGGASHIELKVKSSLLKLNVNMPRNYYQPGCLWTLFDHGCSLNKSSYGVDGTVLNASKRVINIAGGISPNQGADGISYFAQGRLLFTSGVNNGLQVLIDNNDNNGLYLAYPLNAVPSAGDTVTYYPGCSKSYNTCKVKFNNWDNFRGFDKVPPVVISV